ncbi:signal peptidase II [Frankia sp. CcI49]|nr:signal peptidase II [Frankia sp. CcI49]
MPSGAVPSSPVPSGPVPSGAAPSGAGPAPGRRLTPRPAVMIVAVTAVCLIALDVVTKMLAVAKLSGRGPVEIIPGALDLRLTRNSGAAFSLAGGATVFLSLVALAVVVVVGLTARRLASTGWAFVFGAMVGGAVGNLIDRIFRAPGPLRGHVVDFVHIHHWPIFNLADSAIVCGGVLAVVLSLLGIGLDGSRLTGDQPSGARPGTPGAPAASGAAAVSAASGAAAGPPAVSAGPPAVSAGPPAVSAGAPAVSGLPGGAAAPSGTGAAAGQPRPDDPRQPSDPSRPGGQ